MRASEFIVEYKEYPTREYGGVTFTMKEKDGQLIVKALNDFGIKMGHVVFNMDGKLLDPQDLEVYTRSQGQGVASTMYDYIKSLGFTIERSYDQTDAGRGFWNKHRGEDGRVWEESNKIIDEAKVSIKDQIIHDVRKHGPGEYFVRFTGVDKLGYSSKQWFGKTPDIDDPNFSVDYIGSGKGKHVLWFYPLSLYLDQKRTVYASEQPYVWLVKLKPNAWLQTVNPGDKGIQPAPAGKERVGILRMSRPPAALFFKPGFDVVGKYYDYGSQHKRHGQVKGPEVNKPSFFDRVRGYK